MENNWNVIKLGDACNKIGSGITPRGGNSVYKESGIPLIRSQNIYNNYFQYSGIVFIEESVANKMKNVELQEDDVLINITGDSVARCTIVPKDMVGARINQHVSIIRTDKSKLDPYFLKYYLVSDNIQRVLLSMAKEGATRAALTKKMIENIQIKIPDIDTQRKISAISNSFTNKIELNNEMNKTLEEMAQAIFKSWFVDFEPFKDGDFEESELGMIPKGWNTDTIDRIGIFKNGKGLKTEFKTEDGKYNVLGSNGVIGKTNEILFNNFVITIGRVGANYGEIHYELEPCWVSDNAITAQPIEESNKWFLLNNLYKIDYSNFVGGSAQPLITQSSVKTCKIVIPDKEVLNKYFNIINPIYEKININNKNNECLKLIRDTLLPKLISGEIKL